jgi:hypothetical protein
MGRWYHALSLPIRPCSVFPTQCPDIYFEYGCYPSPLRAHNDNYRMGLGKPSYVTVQGSRTTIIMLLHMFPSSALLHFTTMFLPVRIYTWGVPNPHLMVHSKLPRLPPHLGCKACYRSMGKTGDPVPSGHRAVPDHHFTG